MKYILIAALSILSFQVKAGCTDEQAIDNYREAIFHEARNQSYLGRIAIAYVIDRRVKNKRGIAAYRSTICGVVNQPYQFSYTLIPKWKLKRSKKREIHTWNALREIAEYIYYNKSEFNKLPLYGQDHYMTINKFLSGSTGYERKHGCEHVVIEDHIFYKLCSKRTTAQTIMRSKLLKKYSHKKH